MSAFDRCCLGLRPTGFVVVACLALALTGLLGRSAIAQAPKAAGPDEPAADGPEKPKPDETAKPAAKAPAKPAAKAPAKPAAKVPAKPAAKVPAKPGAKAAPAEPYIEDKVDPKPAKRLDILGLLRKGPVTADEWAKIEKYYRDYALPRWTVIANRAEVSKWRVELATDVAVAKSPVRERLLLELLLPKLVDMVKKNYHPVARVNAMLMIGRLNAEEPENLWSAEPPVPLPQAQAHLFAALGDPQLPDAVKVAALVGIKRHAELGAVTTTEQKTAAADALLALATTEAGPAGRSPAAHAWMRALAIDALGALKDPGAGGKVSNALLGIAGQAGAPFLLRCAAAGALGRLTYPEEPVIDPAVVIRQMAQLAREVVGEELQRDSSGKGPLVHRRVQARLMTIHNALTEFTPAVTKTADVALQNSVLEALKSCLKTLEDEDIDDATAAGKLSEQLGSLSQTLAAPAAKKKPKEE